MEALVLVGCGAATWIGTFFLIGGRQTAVPGRVNRALQEAFDQMVAVVSMTGLPRQLLAFANWRGVAGGMAARMSGLLGKSPTTEEASALLLWTLALLPLLGTALSRSLVGGLASGAAGAITVLAMGGARRARDARELAAEMPGVFRTLAVALGAGQTLAQAVEYVGGHERGPAAREFALTSLRMRCGMRAEDALELMANELDAPGVGLMVTALAISQRTGSPLRDLFQHSARMVERRQELEREMVVKTAQVRLSARIVCLLPLLLVVILSMISPDFQKGASTVMGMACLVVAALLDGVALLIMRRLARGIF